MSPIDLTFVFLVFLAALLMWATYKLGRRFASKEERESLKEW